MQPEAFTDDLLRAIADPRRDMHLVAGGFRRTRHGQPMRDKVPVFRDQIENFLRH